MPNPLSVDEKIYRELLTAVGAFSRLYSESDTPFYHSRFIEKLYARTSGALDLSRKDMSFDAKHLGSLTGVGVKTFVASSFKSSKKEKVAEFPKNAGLGDFKNLKPEELANAVAQLRNKRITSDAIEHGIDLDHSIYHCLIRIPGSCMIHEEPYELIDTSAIVPVDQKLNASKTWVGGNGTTYFSDGKSHYSFNGAKSVLMKRFALTGGINSKSIPIVISESIFESILQDTFIGKLGGGEAPIKQKTENFVVLPLYSSKGDVKSVSEKSGINQWMAGGRERKFGEAYIPIPAKIHAQSPGFFPERDVLFSTTLPDGSKIQTKVCQDGSKALMSNPNKDLCAWLYRLIDGDMNTAEKRYIDKNPYTYKDLEAIGKDSVRITKVDDLHFELEMMRLGSYEDFLDSELAI